MMKLLPIEVKAMPVGNGINDKSRFAQVSVNYTKIGNTSNRFQSLESAPFTIRTDSEKTGIHLHFIMPDELTQGKALDSGEIDYPALPDRWLVTRMWTEEEFAQEILVRRFIVESDSLQKECCKQNYNELSVTFPYISDISMPYRFLGRSAPVEEAPLPETARLKKLTAVAPGSPYFAAYYPFCRNVFGIYDDLTYHGKVLEKGRLSYAVCGWCTNKAERVEEIICHGLVTDIIWKGSENDGVSAVRDRPSCHAEKHNRNEKVSVTAVGNTSAEALAAMNQWRDPQRETLAHLFLTEHLQLLHNRNGLLDAGGALHKEQFSVAFTPKELAQKGKKQNKERSGDAEDCQTGLKERLEELNRILYEIRRLSEEKAFWGRQVYDYWLGYLYYAYKKGPVYEKNKKICEESILNGLLSIRKTDGAIRHYETEYQDKRPIGIVLDEVPGERFYMPNNPVTLFGGVGRDFSYGCDGRFREDGESGKREMEDIIHILTLNAGAETGLPVAVELRGDSFFPPLPSFLPCECGKLEGEALLLSASHSGVLAAKAFALAGIAAPDSKQLQKLRDVVKNLQTLPFSSIFSKESPKTLGRAAGFDGVFPSKTAVNYYHGSWNPLMLDWSVLYYPDPAVLEPEPSLRNWKLGSYDLEYISKQPDLGKVIPFSGRIIITPHEAETMERIVMRLTGEKGAAEADILSQCLSDFNEKLLMRSQTAAQPIFSGKEPQFAKEVREEVEEYSDRMVISNDFFSPIRAGFVTFDQLRVIDSFGKYRDIPTDALIISESMRLPQGPALGNLIMLRPRLLQGGRLNFQWRKNEAGCLFGWIVPNHADHNLALYQPDGTLLGYIQLTALKPCIVWISAPGTYLKPEQLPPRLKEITARFLSYGELGEDVLTSFLEYIDSAMTQVNTPGCDAFFCASSFVGRPLAVVCADIWLELAAPEERYKVPELIKEAPDSIKTRNIRLEKAIFEVRLGEKEHHDDGMIGFFDQDFLLYHTYGVKEKDSGCFFSGDTSVRLNPSYQEKYTELTILADPVAGIHLTSGILPRREVRIPEEEVARGLNNMRFTMFCAPVLCSETNRALPSADIQGMEWSFTLPDGRSDAVRNSDGQALELDGLRLEEGWLTLQKVSESR